MLKGKGEMMTDREKVIHALETCIRDDFTTAETFPCRECDYFVEVTDDENYDCMVLMIRDAIALLREQEAVEPTATDEAIRVEYNCGGCGYLVGFASAIHDDMQYRAKFCPECGRKVAWS